MLFNHEHNKHSVEFPDPKLTFVSLVDGNERERRGFSFVKFFKVKYDVIGIPGVLFQHRMEKHRTSLSTIK